MIVSVQLCRAGLGLSRDLLSIFGYQDSSEVPVTREGLVPGPATCPLVIMYHSSIGLIILTSDTGDTISNFLCVDCDDRFIGIGKQFSALPQWMHSE